MRLYNTASIGILQTALLISAFISAPAWAAVCSTDSNTAIADGSGSATPGTAATITIDVPANYVGDIVDLDFQLAIDHTYVGDLIVTLTSPGGTIVTLMDRPLSPTPSGIFGCSGDDIDTIIDDEAATALESQCAGATPTISGSHSPTGLLSDFDGEAIAGTWTLTVTDNAGADTGTIISGGNCLGGTTTAVTISSFKTKQRGNSLIAKWQTSSEAFNLGFHLWGNIDGQWVQLNKRMIASRSIDSTEPQDYRYRVNLTKLEGQVTQVGISAYDTTGNEDFYGPFETGEEYGDQEVARYIDWSKQRSLYDQRMRGAGFTKLAGRWVQLSERREKRLERRANRFPQLTMSIDKSGVYRISYEELLDMGFDLNRFPINKLALTRAGKAIPRIVNNPDPTVKRFGAGSDIIFFAQGPTKEESRYVDVANYQLSFDPEHTVAAPDSLDHNNSDMAGQPLLAETHTQYLSAGAKNSYSFALPGDDPWYDTFIVAFANNASTTFEMTVPESALIDQASRLSINLLGGVNFVNVDADGDNVVEPDHHFKVYINRQQNPDAVYEGFAEGIEPINLEFDTNKQLVHGTNQIELEVIPDNGNDKDAAYFLGASLAYLKNNELSSEFLDMPVGLHDTGVRILDRRQEAKAAYHYDLSGNFAQTAIMPSPKSGELLIDSPINASSHTNAGIWVAGESGYLSPKHIFASAADDPLALDLSEIDYVIIADPSLIGHDLQRFVNAQVEMGRNTKIVSSHAIFNRYSSSQALPNAIAHYLREQSATSHYQYVLLVGGHTYNYRSYGVTEENTPINLIPTFYRPSDGLIKQIPTAVPFVDFDTDGIPDRAIGRWPVRDITQLKNVVDKTLVWHADGSLANSKTSLLIAGANEPRADFDLSTDYVARSLGLRLDPWPEPYKIYMDEIRQDSSIPAGQHADFARQELINAVNQGSALTIFSGHSSSTLWGRQSLLTGNVADQFTNAEAPSLMIPLSCYTTYYETPAVKSLSEILLTDSPNGAVAISSTAVLSRSSDNEQIAKELLKEMTIRGADLGTAVLNVKRKIHAYSPRHQSLVYNWTTLGDPTLSFKLPDVSPVHVVEPPKTVQ